MKQHTPASIREPLKLSDKDISTTLEGKRIVDSEGNIWRVDFVDLRRQAVSLWASHGEIEICVSDLKYYSYAV